MKLFDDAPPHFWYAASCALVVLAGGLTYSAINSSNISVEIANTKISLSGKITKAQELARQLEQAVDRLEETQADYDELKRKYDSLLASSPRSPEVREFKDQIDKLQIPDAQTLKKEVQSASGSFEELNKKLINE